MTRTLVMALMLVSCGEKDGTDTSESTSEGRPVLPAPEAGDGFQMALYGTAPAFEEVWLCEVYPLPVDEITAVQWIEYNQNEGTHHFTLSALGFERGLVPYGTYDCNDLYSDDELMQEAIMVFGGQGEGTGEMHLPDGTVANLPPTIDVLHEIHYVNPTPDEVEIYSEINAYTVPQDAVENSVWGGSVRDEYINIPAGEEHTEWTRCVFNEDVEVLFLAAHQHGLGTEFTIAPFDGETVGEVFFTNDDWHTPKITQYTPPMVVPAGQGFEWTCTWKNTTDEMVVYGNESTDEMCNMSVVHTPFSMTAACEVVESSDGVLWDGS